MKGNLFDNLASDEIKILPKNTKEIEFVKRPGSRAIPLSTANTIKKMPDFVSVHGVSRIGFTLRVEGEMLGKDIIALAREAGITKGTLMLAKSTLPIKAEKRTGDGLFSWRLVAETSDNEE